MIIQIEITGVNVEFTKTAKGGYSTAFVEYLNEKGENKKWKLISFANPAVFDVMKSAKPGEVYSVTTGKNDKDFTEWTSATKQDVATQSVPTKSSPASVVRSTYETPEERAVKQRLIVRQSSLAQAITYAVATKVDTEYDVLQLAERFTAWVFEAPDLFDQPNEV